MGIEMGINNKILHSLGKAFYSQSRYIIGIRGALQNSLDAGATEIRITLDNWQSSGFELTISDNGSGIEDLVGLFLTLGGSSKPTGSIGGYGVESLVTLSMDEWEVISREGRITHDHLKHGLDIDESEAIPVGTVIINRSKSYYGYYSNIRARDYLCTCDFGDCKVYFNGELITPFPIHYEKLETEDATFDTRYVMVTDGGLVAVRLKGLVQYYTGIGYDSDNRVYLWDVETSLSPYDEDYPFTPNRESLISAEQDRLTPLTNALTEQNKKIEKQRRVKEEAFILEDGVAYQGSGINPLETSDCMSALTILRGNIEWLTDNTSYLFGFTDKESYYHAANRIFFLNVNVARSSDSYELLSLAMHLCAHLQEEDHYNTFAAELTRITTMVLRAISDGTLEI